MIWTGVFWRFAGLSVGFDHIVRTMKKMINERKIIRTYPNEKTRRLDARFSEPVTENLLNHSGFAAIIGRPNVGKSIDQPDFGNEAFYYFGETTNDAE